MQHSKKIKFAAHDKDLEKKEMDFIHKAEEFIQEKGEEVEEEEEMDFELMMEKYWTVKVGAPYKLRNILPRLTPISLSIIVGMRYI